MYDNAGTGTGTETDDETATDAAWLTADAAGGAAGEQSVGMSAVRNFQAAPRTAYVDLVCGEQRVRLTVTQTGLSDETNFTALFDETFAQKLQQRDIVADAEKITLQEMAEIAAITELDVSSSSLTSLQGIEYFESLTRLICYVNSLTSLDVSNNTALTELWCYSNQLTELDLSKNTALMWLVCNDNQLGTLVVSGCSVLTTLYCDSNSLASLDVSKNPTLTTLNCRSNSLASLDLSNNTALTELQCYENQLTELDLSKNTALMALNCYDNLLKELDISKNTALIYLECDNNPGDGESKFPVTVWGDSATKPGSLYIPYTSWTYNGKTIAIDYRTATAE